MRVARVFARLLGLGRAVVEGVELDGDVVVVHARPKAKERDRCGRCGRRSPVLRMPRSSGKDWMFGPVAITTPTG